MPTNRSNFIVVALTELDQYGYDETTLPLLVNLVRTSQPDHSLTTHMGVQAFYLSSTNARIRVDALLSDASLLRKTDDRFSTLGIGSAEGELSAEFTSPSKLAKDSMLPMGDASAQAVKNARANSTESQP